MSTTRWWAHAYAFQNTFHLQFNVHTVNIFLNLQMRSPRDMKEHFKYELLRQATCVWWCQIRKTDFVFVPIVSHLLWASHLQVGPWRAAWSPPTWFCTWGKGNCTSFSSSPARCRPSCESRGSRIAENYQNEHLRRFFKRLTIIFSIKVSTDKRHWKQFKETPDRWRLQMRIWMNSSS